MILLSDGKPSKFIIFVKGPWNPTTDSLGSSSKLYQTLPEYCTVLRDQYRKYVCVCVCVCVCVRACVRACVRITSWKKIKKKNTKLEPHRQSCLSTVWTRSGGERGRGKSREKWQRDERHPVCKKKRVKRQKRKNAGYRDTWWEAAVGSQRVQAVKGTEIGRTH